MALYLWIAAGSAVGGVFRFALSGFVAHRFGETLPWGTFAVNFFGSFLIGFIASISSPEGRMLIGPTTRHLLMTGILGGFTTYSSFSLQTLNLARDGDFMKAGVYSVGTLFLCFSAVWMGHVLASLINTVNPA
ncbi:MAG: camphor resistance protein CrcB [Verrucomicrobia bacterium ADurb.Bin474]|nr:MAG: camphor resistance protein CrcB [Verrucomicrobia bacterium ADurb.Bin474]